MDVRSTTVFRAPSAVLVPAAQPSAALSTSGKNDSKFENNVRAMTELSYGLVFLTDEREAKNLRSNHSPKGLQAHGDLLSCFADLAKAIAQEGDDLASEIRAFEARQDQGKTTSGEEKVCSDKLENWHRSATSAYQCLRNYISTFQESFRSQKWTTATELTEALCVSTKAAAAQGMSSLFNRNAELNHHPSPLSESSKKQDTAPHFKS